MNFLHLIRIDSGSITLLILVAIGIFFTLQNKRDKKGTDYRNISGEELNAIMTLNKNLKIIDVRSHREFEDKHIPNAINIPIDTFEETVIKLLPDKKELYIIYCESGLRAKKAINIMKKMEYLKIYNLGTMNKYFNRVK